MKKAYRTTKNGIMNPLLRREGTDPSIELPETTPEDAGKVLIVDDSGNWTKGEAEALPEVSTADNGKVLTVSGGAWDKADAPKELPAVTTDDNGKVLGVDSGAWAAVAASGGLPEVTDADLRTMLTAQSGEWVKKTLKVIEPGVNVAARYSITIPAGETMAIKLFDSANWANINLKVASGELFFPVSLNVEMSVNVIAVPIHMGMSEKSFSCRFAAIAFATQSEQDQTFTFDVVPAFAKLF